MNMEIAKKTKGFMCHSQSSTAICMSQDRRSVIVPRRPDRMPTVDHFRLLNSTKYVRLGEQRKVPAPSIRRSSFHVSSREKKDPLTVSDGIFQVVVMRVSIHCQGCAGKVKKHLSKMEGVTSFSIDLESKRVTVMGHVSPSGVLESISKVKKAEFWINSEKQSFRVTGGSI
ncbi:heavy metal transport/detoxification superfamily protein [Striga asiatica]|uniref:Heavy metal transport/detoxification superfamily protein n=1 Tax=Striga asiatica TaxID=4170 RepID=A0A5A7QCN6_STRAF|nr:heavy metal transport/detoxification superfamily protein [Striga asiatica]